MKKILPVCFIALATGAYAQPEITWQLPVGGSGFETAAKIIELPSGGYLMAGTTNSNDGDIRKNEGQSEAWLVKIDEDGKLVWSKTFGGSDEEYISSMILTKDGNIVIVGAKETAYVDYWIAKISPQGQLIWESSFGSSGVDFATDVEETTDGGFIVAGTIASDGNDVDRIKGRKDIWVIKLDKFGALLWQNTIGGSGEDRAQTICQTSDGGFFLTGASVSRDGDLTENQGGFDVWTVKLDAYGKLVWQQSFGGVGDEFSYDARQCYDGTFILCGNTFSAGGDVHSLMGGSDYWLMRISHEGNLLWEKTYGGSFDDYATSIDLTSDGGFVLSGYSGSADGMSVDNKGMFDYFVVKTNHAGEVQWTKCMGGSERDYSSVIVQTSDNGYIIAGDSFSNDNDVRGNHGNEDIWIAKLSAAPAVSSASDMPVEPELVAAFINRLYPNPVSDVLTIEVGQTEELISYTLLNSAGQIVWTQSSTDSRIQVNVAELQTGFYVLQVTNQKQAQAHRVIVQH